MSKSFKSLQDLFDFLDKREKKPASLENSDRAKIFSNVGYTCEQIDGQIEKSLHESPILCGCGTLHDAFETALRNVTKAVHNQCSRWNLFVMALEHTLFIRAFHDAGIKASFEMNDFLTKEDYKNPDIFAKIQAVRDFTIFIDAFEDSRAVSFLDFIPEEEILKARKKMREAYESSPRLKTRKGF